LYVGDGIKSWHSTTAAGGSNGDEKDAAEAMNKMGFFQRFRVSHGRITTPLQYFNLQTLLTDATGGCGDAIPSVGQFESFGNNAAFAATKDDGLNEIDTPIWLRYEPFILHVMCRSLKAASVLMALARPSFKNVGLTSWNSNVDDEDEDENDSNTAVIHRADKNQQCKGGGAKYLVAIWGDEGLDMPLSLPASPQCGLYYNPDNKDTECNAEWLAQLVNERHVRNWNKIDRFVEAVKGLEEGVDVDIDLSEMYLDDEDLDQRFSNGAKAARAASGLPIPRSYDVIGDVAVLNSVPEGDEETLKKVGDWILSRNKAIKVCLCQMNWNELDSYMPTFFYWIATFRYVLHATIHSQQLIDLPEKVASFNSLGHRATQSSRLTMNTESNASLISTNAFSLQEWHQSAYVFHNW
jgi:tRNA(Phe) wybutosine-synthesizing methylase Tyw3